MKFIRFFMAAAIAVFSLQFSTASAATLVKAAGTSLHTANAASAPQHRRHVHRHHRRIRRHRK